MRKSYQPSHDDSIIDVEQRFDKIVNNENEYRKPIIVKYIIICVLVLAFVVFYLVYSLSLVKGAQTSVSNFQMLGRRPALIRQARLLFLMYSMNPNPLRPTGFQPASVLNQQMIDEFYLLESDLVYLSLTDNADMFDLYTDGDVCANIASFSASSLFN
jgi:hypothetical protein